MVLILGSTFLVIANVKDVAVVWDAWRRQISSLLNVSVQGLDITISDGSFFLVQRRTPSRASINFAVVPITYIGHLRQAIRWRTSRPWRIGSVNPRVLLNIVNLAYDRLIQLRRQLRPYTRMEPAPSMAEVVPRAESEAFDCQS